MSGLHGSTHYSPPDVETVTYLGCTVDVYADGVVVVTAGGEIGRFVSMASARRWIRCQRRARQAG